jgi:hypothetical protein
MTKITQKTVFCVGDFTFDTEAEAQSHIRYGRAHAALQAKLLDDSCNIYWRDTSADEVAQWIIENFDSIKSLIEGEHYDLG